MTSSSASDSTPESSYQRWDEAFTRVESYLRAYHLQSRVLLNQVVAEIIEEARRKVSEDGSLKPVAAAMEIAQQRVGLWVSKAGFPADWEDGRERTRARLSLILAELPTRWSRAFLSNDPAPEALKTALREGSLQSGPELRFRNMAPAPLEFEPLRERARPIIARTHFAARAILGGLGVVCLGAIAWAAIHSLIS